MTPISMPRALVIGICKVIVDEGRDAPDEAVVLAGKHPACCRNMLIVRIFLRAAPDKKKVRQCRTITAVFFFIFLCTGIDLNDLFLFHKTLRPKYG